jgi:hypothetical protein
MMTPAPTEMPTPPDLDDSVELLRLWTSSTGERIVLRVDTMVPAAWGIILVDIAKHIAHAYERQGKTTANAAFAEVIQGFIAELGQATDSPS